MEEPTALTQADNQQQQNRRSPFFAKLPVELRLRIYKIVLDAPCALKIPEHTQHDGDIFNISLLRVCKQAYLEGHDVLFKTNTIRTSASNFRMTIERCEAHVQYLSVWVDNDHVALLNAIATVCRGVEPNAFTNLHTLTVEIDNLHSYSVRELLAIIPDCSIPAVDQVLECPAIGLYTLAIPRSNNNTITLRLEHTLIRPAWQIASTATEPLPPEADPQDWIPAAS